MSKIDVRCPKCDARYSVDESLLGKKGRCKKCDTSFVLVRSRPVGEDGVPVVWEQGDVILDLYEVLGELGEGGMGKVYKVRHRGWNRDLAVKTVRPQLTAKPGAMANFEREAETWVNLGLHPHAVSCIYVRRLGGLPRVFAEYVDGGTLTHWIESGKLYEGGPQAALECILDIAIQFAWGLHYAHERGLIHRDVKPDNVMMTPDGVAKVTDFGLARIRPAATPAQEGTVMIEVTSTAGTVAYMSPEQMRGKALTSKTDLWSWAVSIVDLFVGRVHRGLGSGAGEALETYLQHGPEDERLPMMPAAVAGLLGRCFEDKPEARPKDMLVVATALQDIYAEVTGRPYAREMPEPAELLADSLNNQALSLFDLGKRQEAEQKWHEALGVDPHHPEANYNWGLIEWRSARMTDEQLLGKLREVKKTCADPVRMDYWVGLVQLEQNDCEAAIQLFTQIRQSAVGGAEVAAALTLAQGRVEYSSRPLRDFDGHTSSVSSVAWSPDSRFALSGSGDGALRLWEASSGRCLRSFEGHTGKVWSVAWSPDDRFALSGSEDQTLRVWEISSGCCLRSFEGHDRRVNSVAWSPDGRFALCGTDDQTLRLWEASSGRYLRSFEGHTGKVWSVAWSPDSRFALSGSDDQTLRLWEASSGRCLRSFEGHTGLVSSLAWSPDGRFALSGGGDMRLRLWEASSGRCLRLFEGHKHSVISVAWSPDGCFALSGSYDKTLRLWEVSSSRCLRTFEGDTPVTLVAWSPDGRFALSKDWRLRLWCMAGIGPSASLTPSQPSTSDHRTYRRLLTLSKQALATQEVATAVDFLARARQEPGCVRRSAALELARKMSRFVAHGAFAGAWEERTFPGQRAPVASVAWSPDGRFALSGSEDQKLRLWEVSSGRCLRTFEGHTDRVNSVVWSPDGRFALSGSSDKTLRLWEVSSGRCLRAFEGHTNDVHSVAWSPDGRFALSGGWHENLRLWEVSSGYCVHAFRGDTHCVTSVAWSPDGRFILWSSLDRMPVQWEVSNTSNHSVRLFEGHTDIVTSVAWSPDGRFALSGGRDDTLRLWEASSGRCLRSFEGHTGWVNSVAWSPDGRFALSGSDDRTLRLWEVSSGRCLRSFEGYTDIVKSVAWSPDGRFALSGSWDHALRLWALDWELERNQPADWHDGAQPYLEAFLAVHTPYAAMLPENRTPTGNELTSALTRTGKPNWTDQEFQCLLERLGCAGYGWLRPEGVRRELEKMAITWQGSPLLPGT